MICRSVHRRFTDFHSKDRSGQGSGQRDDRGLLLHSLALDLGWTRMALAVFSLKGNIFVLVITIYVVVSGRPFPLLVERREFIQITFPRQTFPKTKKQKMSAALPASIVGD